MGLILLGLLLVFGLPLVLLFLGVTLAIWVTLAVAGIVWGIVAFVFGLLHVHGRFLQPELVV